MTTLYYFCMNTFTFEKLSFPKDEADLIIDRANSRLDLYFRTATGALLFINQFIKDNPCVEVKFVNSI